MRCVSSPFFARFWPRGRSPLVQEALTNCVYLEQTEYNKLFPRTAKTDLPLLRLYDQVFVARYPWGGGWARGAT